MRGGGNVRSREGKAFVQFNIFTVNESKTKVCFTVNIYSNNIWSAVRGVLALDLNTEIIFKTKIYFV